MFIVSQKFHRNFSKRTNSIHLLTRLSTSQHKTSASLPKEQMTDLIDQTTEAIQLPNDVHSAEQLALLPEKYLSHDPQRPLLLTSTATTKSGDNVTQQFKYALRPLWFSVLFILIVECLERLTYYGINTTETGKTMHWLVMTYRIRIPSAIISNTDTLSLLSLLDR